MKDLEDSGFGREKEENPLKLQRRLHLGVVSSKTKQKQEKQNQNNPQNASDWWPPAATTK